MTNFSIQYANEQNKNFKSDRTLEQSKQSAKIIILSLAAAKDTNYL